MAQILLVEDDTAACRLIQQYMNALCSKHQLTVFPTASAAFNWASNHSVDLFILDIQLPDYQGRGYGLFNDRRMVEQHGGKILVKNEEKDGLNYLTIGALISGNIKEEKFMFCNDDASTIRFADWNLAFFSAVSSYFCLWNNKTLSSGKLPFLSSAGNAV